MKNQKQNQMGAGFFFKSDKKPDFFKLLKEAVLSESKLLKNIKEYSEFMKKYQESYKTHLQNLDKLDEYFEDEDVEFDSFHKSFNVIYKDIDRNINNNTFDNNKTLEQPLLLKNYNGLESYYEVEDIIEYHLIQQINYLIQNNYSESDRLLIRQVAFRNIMKNPEFKVFSIENKMTEFLPLQHHNYQIDYDKMKEILDQVIVYIKSVIPDVNTNNNLIKEKKPKDRKRSEKIYRLYGINNNNNKKTQKISENEKEERKEKTIKEKTIKEKTEIIKIGMKPKTKKKESNTYKNNESNKNNQSNQSNKVSKVSKKKVGRKKKLEEITIPNNEPILPVLKIDIPKKIKI